MRNAKSTVAMILLLKTYQKWFLCCHLPCSLKIFIEVFAFLYAKANSKKLCGEMSFPSFSRRILMSAFLLRFEANYLKKIHGYSHIFVDSSSPCKDLRIDLCY